MKQLELELKKRLLIVEGDFMFYHNGRPLKFISKVSGLTEGIAKGLVHQSIHTGLFAHYVKDIPVNTYCYKSALESFISAIESKGYYWGENPYNNHEWRQIEKWDEAESKTFNPETLIFEIL